jgi:ankyrin repeat protein
MRPKLVAIILLVVSSIDSPAARSSEPGHAQSQAITPLLQAVASLDETKVRALLQAGAKPDDPIAARSPLIQAITSFNPSTSRELLCHKGIVKALLEHGADVNRPDPMIGALPLEDAFGVGDLECARIIRSAGAKVDPPETGFRILRAAVDAAARTGNLAAIDLAIEFGIDLNRSRGSDGGTALHEAVWVNSARVAQALLSRGINPCATNTIPQTPLDMARNLQRSPELIEVLASVTRCGKAGNAGS